jgi:hypothetical protein
MAKQADALILLAKKADLFHSPDGTGFADITVDGCRQTWPVKSKAFRRWLARAYYESYKSAANSEAMSSALNVIEATAHFDGPQLSVFLRVGSANDKLYLDLCNDQWQAVEIDVNGWRLIDTPPVRLRRTPGMLPLPIPQLGGSIEALRHFLNVKSDASFVLIIACSLAWLRDRGPYPVLVLAGEQGSAKSTTCALLRALVDPNTAPLRALPREDRDLFIAATNAHVQAFDNVSGLSWWISDTLCRLSTGGGFAVRSLYTDTDEVLFSAMRPVMVNGIEDCITRPDLADRAIFETLETIPENKRKSERDLWAEFERQRPAILGALLTAVARGLRNLPTTTLPTLPRMADFALWAKACEVKSGAADFEAAYAANRDEAIVGVIEADPVAAAVRSFMTMKTDWKGTASDLLDALAELVGDGQRKNKNWPDSARALAGRLRRAATFLRKIGIDVTFSREGRARTRTIQLIAGLESARSRPSAPSPSPAAEITPLRSNGLPADRDRTVARPADNHEADAPAPVRADSLKTNRRTVADDADANFQLLSGSPLDPAPTRCAHCGQPAERQALRQVGDGTRMAWLHRRCEVGWLYGAPTQVNGGGQ